MMRFLVSLVPVAFGGSAPEVTPPRSNLIEWVSHPSERSIEQLTTDNPIATQPVKRPKKPKVSWSAVVAAEVRNNKQLKPKKNFGDRQQMTQTRQQYQKSIAAEIRNSNKFK